MGQDAGRVPARPAASNATATGSSSSTLAPQCGDIGWDYISGLGDRGGMVCRVSCGYQWIASDLGWRAQTLPGNALSALQQPAV
jgi:hypothetical protein